ncbi:hypothetical protein XENOCAPTIV_012983, partial [Xenoophorus captivus]
CECSAAGTVDNSCRPDPRTQTCVCKPGFTGDHCDTCTPGFYGLNCQVCGCSTVGSLPERCNASGRCLCKPEFQGPRCEQCRSGFHSYPSCQECSCDPRTSFDTSCTVSGICHCRPNYSGASCDQCSPGYYGYPSCTRKPEAFKVCCFRSPRKCVANSCFRLQPASVPQRVPVTRAVTRRRDSARVCLAWWG